MLGVRLPLARLATRHATVAITEFARHQALGSHRAVTALHAASDNFQTLLPHQAFEGDVHLADHALSDGMKLAPGIFQLVMDGVQVGGAARYAVEPFGQNDFKPARLGVLDQFKQASAVEHGGAGLGGVAERLDNLETVAVGVFAVYRFKLIANAAVILQVGRISRVERRGPIVRFHCRPFPVVKFGPLTGGSFARCVARDGFREFIPFRLTARMVDAARIGCRQAPQNVAAAGPLRTHLEHVAISRSPWCGPLNPIGGRQSHARPVTTRHSCSTPFNIIPT